MHSSNAVSYPGVQLSWRRVLSIAQNTPDPAAIDDKLEDEIYSSPTSRIQCMGRALQNMYTITSQGNLRVIHTYTLSKELFYRHFLFYHLDEGYTAFILTMVQELQYDCPVSMTFVKHIIEFSEIPSKETIRNTSIALLNNGTANCDNQKINQSIMWSMLARKFAGNLAEAMWAEDIATILIQSLMDSSRAVKIFALLALESFALTGT